MRGGCSAQLRKGLPVLLSPSLNHNKEVHQERGVQNYHVTLATAEHSSCLLNSYPKLATGSAVCIFYF